MIQLRKLSALLSLFLLAFVPSFSALAQQEGGVPGLMWCMERKRADTEDRFAFLLCYMDTDVTQEFNHWPDPAAWKNVGSYIVEDLPDEYTKELYDYQYTNFMPREAGDEIEGAPQQPEAEFEHIDQISPYDDSYQIKDWGNGEGFWIVEYRLPAWQGGDIWYFELNADGTVQPSHCGYYEVASGDSFTDGCQPDYLAPGLFDDYVTSDNEAE